MNSHTRQSCAIQLSSGIVCLVSEVQPTRRFYFVGSDEGFTKTRQTIVSNHAYVDLCQMHFLNKKGLLNESMWAPLEAWPE